MAVPVTVVGGTSDTQPPQQISTTPPRWESVSTPSPGDGHSPLPKLPLGASIELTAIVSDEHGPVTAELPAVTPYASCTPPIVTPLNATTSQLTTTCTAVGPPITFHDYYQVLLAVYDALGHRSSIVWYLDPTP